MLSAAADAGRGIVYGAVGPRVALWRCGGAWAVQGLRALGRFGAVPGGMFRGLPRHEGGAVIAGGSRWSVAQGLRALGCFVDAGWQDLRAVHDSRDPCSEKCPFLAGSSRGVSSDGDLRGISDAWRAYLAKASPLSDAWRANLAANWRFSRPRPLSGCVGRKNCHGLPPGDAPRRNLATARPPRTHRARILPLPVRPRAHQGAILPPPDAQKRISRAFCHRRAPGNASRHNLATTGRPRRTPRATMCYGSRLAHGRGSERPPVCLRHPTSRRRWTAGVAGGSGVGGGTTR